MNHTVWKSKSDVDAFVLDCDIVVHKFELQSRYYVHFRTNTLTKSMSFLNSPAMG